MEHNGKHERLQNSLYGKRNHFRKGCKGKYEHKSDTKGDQLFSSQGSPFSGRFGMIIKDSIFLLFSLTLFLVFMSNTNAVPKDGVSSIETNKQRGVLP